MEFGGERYADDRCLVEAVGPDWGATAPQLQEAKARLSALLAGLLRRAQAAGQARPDLEPDDLGVLLTAALRAVPPRPDQPDAWRRYLGVILDGMRPEGPRRSPEPRPRRSTSPPARPPAPGRRPRSSTRRSSSSGA